MEVLPVSEIAHFSYDPASFRKCGQSYDGRVPRLYRASFQMSLAKSLNDEANASCTTNWLLFFRASIWWKYLDRDSVLPPPFTGLYFLHLGLAYLFKRFNLCSGGMADGAIDEGNLAKEEEEAEKTLDVEVGAEKRRRSGRDIRQERIERDRREFEKR